MHETGRAGLLSARALASGPRLHRGKKSASSMAIAVEVAAAIVVIRVVVMLSASTITFPVSLEEALAVVMRPHPMRTSIRRTGPVAIMPFVMVPDRIPIALNPGEAGSGMVWNCVDHARGWRRSDSDPY
jgi:hypothetical protein